MYSGNLLLEISCGAHNILPDDCVLQMKQQELNIF